MPRDPRTFVTPDAFTVAPELLGFALATPRQRLFAIALDGVFAAIVARTPFQWLLALALALVLWRAMGGPIDRALTGRTRWVLRLATLVFALVIVGNIWQKGNAIIHRMANGQAEQPATAELDEDVADKVSELGLTGREQAQLVTRIAALELGDKDAAAERAGELGKWIAQHTSPGHDRDELVAGLAESMRPSALAAFQQALDQNPPPAAADTLPAAAADSALVRYVAARAQGDTVATRALEPAAIEALAGDTVNALLEENRDLRQENGDLSREVKTYRDRASEKGGVKRFLSAASDDLGIGFGWFALYFTAFLVIGRGQTPGKRIIGIKVIRLDNRPIGWWLAFERFGGYAASFSTGLLGFAQILWDRNRQALHDKATETVVIRLEHGQPLRLA